MMMKKFNAWMEKVGVDKLLHFAVGGWCTALCLLFGWVAGIVGAFVVLFLSCVKETAMDSSADIRDVFWSAAGALVSLAAGAVYYFLLA